MFGSPEVSYHKTHSARDWLSILRTPYPTQNLQRKYFVHREMPGGCTSMEFSTQKIPVKWLSS
jgi:phenylalanine-4-hydroxylase